MDRIACGSVIKRVAMLPFSFYIWSFSIWWTMMSDWLRVLPQLPARVLKDDSPFSSAEATGPSSPLRAMPNPNCGV
jgi:hypothetical protein